MQKKNKKKFKNKKLNSKIKKNKKHINEMVKKIKNILIKINSDNSVNLEKYKINNKKELKLNEGIFIGNLIYNRREGKGLMYYNNGNRYKGDWMNDIKEGK